MIINMRHSHESQIESEQGLMKYFRHCVYDAAAEWQAQQHRARMDPDTIKMLKDCLLRVPFQIEQHATARDVEPSE